VVTERLCQAVSNLSLFGRTKMPLTLSIGLTEATPEDDAVTLIARADKALYQAKSDGRNCRRVVDRQPMSAGTPYIGPHPGAPPSSNNPADTPVWAICCISCSTTLMQ
jgi:hypothetical protein